MTSTDAVRKAKIIVGIDRSVFRRQVANMPVRGEHLKSGAEIFVYSLRLGGRLYNDQWMLRFSHGFFWRTNSGRQRGEASGKLPQREIFCRG